MQDIIEYIRIVSERRNLTKAQSEEVFNLLLTNKATPVQIAALLVALRVKGETIDEITGAALSVRSHALKLKAPDNTIDTCGTGGDSSGTYNISTAVAILVAACGVPVAKHGNKAVSSQSGSSDVLSELGIKIEDTIPNLENKLDKLNIAFLFAPQFHQALKNIGPIRKECGIRTIFNILGPLCNPANTLFQLLGVYSKELVEPLAQVLYNLGSKKAWVVHGYGGLTGGIDELTITGESIVCELDNGKFRTFILSPADAGLKTYHESELKGGDAKHNAAALRAILAGEQNAYSDIVLLNTAAALVVAGKATSLKEGVVLAKHGIESGKALELLTKLATL